MKLGSDGVTDVPLPEHAAERPILHLVGVLAARQHPSHADDHALRLLRERRALGAERKHSYSSGRSAPKKRFEERQLVVALLWG